MKIQLALLLIHVLSRLPLPLLYRLAWLPATVLYVLPWRKHKVIAAHIALAFPEMSPARRRALHRRNILEMVRLALESGLVWHGSAERIQRRIRKVHGWDQVEQAQQAGQGVLLIGGHLGNWEVDALYVSLRGPFTGLYKPPRDRAVDEAVTRSRSRFGARLVAAGSPAMRHMLRELRRGGIVGLLMDQQPRQGEGVFAPFFDHPALTMTLVHRLARHTDCAVIFGHSVRLPGGRGFDLHFETVTELVAGTNLETAAAAMNRVLEQHIRTRPEQYLWLYKRFALQPCGQAGPYA